MKSQVSKNVLDFRIRGDIGRRDFLRYSLGSITLASTGAMTFGCGGGDAEANLNATQVPTWPISSFVFTTAQQQVLPIAVQASSPQINPREVSMYAPLGYSAWEIGPGLVHTKRSELAPGHDLNAAIGPSLLSFFAMTDIHITDKESPAQTNYMGWSAKYGPSSAYHTSAYTPVLLSTTQVLDAAIQTVNALHQKAPFDFGIFLGDAINNAQYNELRWYIDVIDGKLITPSSGVHIGADSIDYQKPFKAAGLDKNIPWYQVLGNHDQYFNGWAFEDEKLMQAHVSDTVLNMANSFTNWRAVEGSGFYMGVIDGATPYGEVIAAGPVENFSTPPKVIADPDRRSLATQTSSSLNWMTEFFNTSSTPKGHGFTASNLANDSANYSFLPKSNLPVKIIVLDVTCKGPNQPNYALGSLDQQRLDWLVSELNSGQANNQLVVIAAHIPINPQNHLTDPTLGNFSFYRKPGFTDASILAVLHQYPNLILWMSGHRHVNTVTPQAYNPADLSDHPENSFWEVETSSFHDFPPQFRSFDVRRNSDNTVSILVTNIDVAISAGSPAAKSRDYALGAARIFGATPSIIADTRSLSYNAELVKQLTPEMQAVIARH